MKHLHFLYQTEYFFDSPICDHAYTIKIYPREWEGQRVVSLAETVTLGDSHSYSVDSFGNKMVYGHLKAPHQSFGFEICGTICVDAAKRDMDDAFLPLFRTQSSMTGETGSLRAALERAVAAAEKASPHTNGLEGMTRLQQTAYLSKYCHTLLTYTPHVTDVTTTAGEALELGRGVCQDYAHILLSFLRMLHIPARYVVGCMLGEGYTHAWVEVFCDGCWYGLDPTNARMVNDEYIKLSHGRDYNDTIVCKGHFYGNAGQKQDIRVQVEEV